MHCGYRDPLPLLKGPGRGVTLATDPYLRPKLKKEYSNTSTPPLGLHGLLQGEIHLYFYDYAISAVRLGG